MVIGVAATVTVRFYSYLFSKSVEGEVLRVETVGPTETIVTNSVAALPKQLFSFAVALRDAKGEIHTGSTEDRQWAVVQVGQCAEAKFLPYPPWVLDKSGTFYGVRLIRLFECKKETQPVPAPVSTPTPTQSTPSEKSS